MRVDLGSGRDWSVTLDTRELDDAARRIIAERTTPAFFRTPSAPPTALERVARSADLAAEIAYAESWWKVFHDLGARRRSFR